MSEEVPFRSIKITLSEEALTILANLRKAGSFRSDSMTIEECIRTIEFISTVIAGHVLYLAKEKRTASTAEQAEWFRDVVSKITRFISRETWEQARVLTDSKSSAGT